MFLAFSVLVANPKKLLFTVANPTRGLLNRKKRTKEKVWQHTPHHPPDCSSFGENKSKSKSRDASTGATQVSIGLASVEGYLRLVAQANGCGPEKFYAPVCDNKFPSLVASLFSWRCLAASTSSFLHAAMNLRPPSVTASTHSSAFSAVAFQSPTMPNARMSLWTQSVHSFSFPPRPLRTAPSRFSKTIRFGSRPPLIRRGVPSHKSILVCNIVSILSHRVISRARLYEVI